MSKKRPRRRHHQPDDDRRRPQQLSAEAAASLRKQLLAGVKVVGKVLTAISNSFAPRPEGIAGQFVEAAEEDSILRARTEGSGGMMILSLVLSQRTEPQVVTQHDNLAQLWHMLIYLCEDIEAFEPLPTQKESLCRAFQLLSTCAKDGTEEQGLAAVRMVAMTFQAPGTVRDIIIDIYTKTKAPKPKGEKVQLTRTQMDQVHRITMGVITVYRRIGILHCFLQTLPAPQ